MFEPHVKLFSLGPKLNILKSHCIITWTVYNLEKQGFWETNSGHFVAERHPYERMNVTEEEYLKIILKHAFSLSALQFIFVKDSSFCGGHSSCIFLHFSQLRCHLRYALSCLCTKVASNSIPRKGSSKTQKLWGAIWGLPTSASLLHINGNNSMW